MRASTVMCYVLIVIAWLSQVVIADPVYIVVYNQENEVITDKCVIVVNNRIVEIYNSTHAIVKVNGTALVKIYVRSVKVYEFLANASHAYKIKVRVGKLTLKLPRDVKAYITILASGETIEVSSFDNSVVEIDNIPFGLIKVRVVGAVVEERVFNFQGGVIEVREQAYVKWREFLPWLGVSLIPICSYVIYSLARKPKLKVKKFKSRGVLLQLPKEEAKLIRRYKYIKLPRVGEKSIEVELEGKPLKKKSEKERGDRDRRGFLSIADILDKLEKTER